MNNQVSNTSLARTRLAAMAATSGVNLVWNLGVMDPGQQNVDFSRQIFEKFDFFQAISPKNSIFSGKF